MHSRLSKPKVSEVKQWFLMEDDSNQVAKLYYADIDDAFIRVMPSPNLGKVKYFYGETAWMDARRFAGDIYTKWMHNRD